MMPYKIQKGDTLSELAQRFNVPMSALADANQIADVDKIYYDRMLNIPVQQGGAQTFPYELDLPMEDGEHIVDGQADIKAYTGDNQILSPADILDSPAFSGIGAAISEWWDSNKKIHTELATEQDDAPEALQYPTKPTLSELRSEISGWWDRNRKIGIEQSGGPGPSERPTKPTLSELGSEISGWFDRNREAHEELAEKHGSPSPEELGYTTAPTSSELGAAITHREPYASPYMIMAPSPEELEDSTKPTLGDWGRSIKSTGYDGLVGFINRLENVDQYIKAGQHEHDLRNFSNLLTSTYRSAKENFTEDLSIIKNDFLYTLRNFVDDNNLDKSGLDKLIQLIDVDWLYDATGVRNLRKEREEFSKATITGSYAQGGLAQQVRNVAAQGRYGDSMLMHVNPAEVRGLSQVAPITINPQTGQPEAFLPFLAPLLGSMLGPSLFGALGATGALTGVLGSALGSGLAQWAATGDVKKGLLAGITGYGIGSALQGAGATAAATTEAAKQTAALTGDATKTLLQNPSMVTQGTGVNFTGPVTSQFPVTPGALNTAGQSALNTTMAAAQPGIQYAGQAAADAYAGTGAGALRDAFSGGFGSGMQNLTAAVQQPAALAGIAGGMAPTSIMESQELYEQQIAQRAREDEEKRRQNFLMNPEPILYSAQGGTTNIEDGGSTSAKDLLKMLSPAYSLATTGDYLNILGGDVTKMGLLPALYDNFNQKEEEKEIDKSLEMDSNLLSQQMMANGGRTNFNGGGFTDYTAFDSDSPDFYGGRAGDNTYFSGDQQRFTPAREAYDVNPNFMAGFQPETMYFNPATINAPAVATSTGGPKSVPDTYEGSKGGYGVPSLSIAPQQIIDPYAAYTGPDPEGLIQGEVGILPITPPPPDGGIGDPGTGDPGAPIGAPPTGGGPGMGGPGRGGPGMGGPGMGWLYDMLPDDLIDTGIGGGFGGGGFGGIGNINLSGLDDLDFSNFDFSGFNPTPPVMGPPAAVAPPAAIPPFTLPDDAIDTGIGGGFGMGGPGMGGPGMGGPGMPIGAPPVLPPEFISPGQPPVEVPVAPPVQPPIAGGPGRGGPGNRPGMRPPMPPPPAMPPPMPPPQVAPPVQPPMGFFGDTDTDDSPVAPPMGYSVIGDNNRPVAPPMRIEAPPLVEPPRPPIMPPPVMPPPQVAPPTMPSPPVMQPPIAPPVAPPIAPPVMEPMPMPPPQVAPPPVMQPPAPPPVMQPPAMPPMAPLPPPKSPPFFSISPPAKKKAKKKGKKKSKKGSSGRGRKREGGLIKMQEGGLTKSEIESLLEQKVLQRHLLTLSEKDRRKYFEDRGRQLERHQEFFDNQPLMNRPQSDLATMMAAKRLRDLDLLTRETNKKRPTIETLDEEIKNLEDEMNFYDLSEYLSDPVQEQGYQEGGIVDLAANNQAMMAEQMPSQPTTDLMQDPLTQETIQFLMGDTDNQQVVNDFIAKYGNEVFLQLRNSVLQALVPDAQTEGQIEGVGQSGMADDILGRIGADEKIAVSQDEFIVPADVVSALGDGSSDAGSNRLYEMMDRVRQAKTGGTTQPPMIDLNRVMPA